MTLLERVEELQSKVEQLIAERDALREEVRRLNRNLNEIALSLATLTPPEGRPDGTES